MKKLLNIDGGGIKVFFSLLVLQYIELKTGRRIIDLFDYFAGVSASSIVLGSLLSHYTIDEIIELFQSTSKYIFYRSCCDICTSLNGLLYSKYSNYYIETQLQKLFNNIKLKHSIKPLSILTYDLSTHSPKSFHSYDNSINNIELWKLVRGSTAAPIFFPPFKNNDDILIDGAVIANNLSDYTYQNAKKYFGNNDKMLQLSIGTGIYLQNTYNIPSGLCSWLNYFSTIFNISSNYIMNSSSRYNLSNKSIFYRFDFILENDICLDDYNSFDTIKKIFDKWIIDNKDYIDDLCNELIN